MHSMHEKYTYLLVWGLKRKNAKMREREREGGGGCKIKTLSLPVPRKNVVEKE